MIRTLSATAFAMAASTASAQLSTYEMREELATVVAAEEYCGLTYDQEAIFAYVEANAPTDDIYFATDLRLAIEIEVSRLSEMMDLTKNTHCRAVETVAGQRGFLK